MNKKFVYQVGNNKKVKYIDVFDGSSKQFVYLVTSNTNLYRHMQ